MLSPLFTGNVMDQYKEELEKEIRSDIIRSLLSLVLPPNWNSETTMRYVINYLNTSQDKK